MNPLLSPPRHRHVAPGHARVTGLFTSLFMGLFILFAVTLSPGQAAAQQAETQARRAQYVFVIDDSSSMSTASSSGKTPAADPDRLSVFAVRSLLSMLDDTDEATLVRLNGPPTREPITPIAPLSQNRQRLLQELDLKGKLASYDGELGTPCATTLEAVKQELARQHRPGVAQTIFFLTDGQCSDDLSPLRHYTRGMESSSEGLFKFYLLRFSGRDYSRELAKLASETGGEEALVSAKDPTTILQPFASALSRSQGHEAYLLTPGHAELDAHSGARRIRLLAVAPDQGQDLTLSLSPTRPGNKAPQLRGDARVGLHQYADGRRFRYAAVDYVPGDVPVEVQVAGAGTAWKVVAVPEYRLALDLYVEEGSCQRPGQQTQAVEVGASACVSVVLTNERGEVIEETSMSRDAEASVLYQAPGSEKAVELPGNQVGNTMRFTLERANLERGDHIFSPLMRIRQPGRRDAKLTLRGRAHTLQVSTRTVQAVPGRFDLGEARPGDEFYNELTLKGNFPSTLARISVEDRQSVPECIHVELSGVAEGEPQKLTANQSYSLAVKVAPYCGKISFTRDIETAVRVEFDRASNSRAIPSVVIPLHVTLVSQLGHPASITATMKGGQSKAVRVELSGNHQKPIHFKALIPDNSSRSSWPDDDLRLSLVDESGKVVRDADGEPERAFAFTLAPGQKSSTPLVLRIDSDVCCHSGSYRSELALVSTGPGSREALRIPITITVEEAGVWSCWGSMILWGVLAVVLLLMLLYVFNMFRQSHFLRRDLVASKLVPLRWDEWREAEGQGRQAEDVKRMVHKSLPWWQRLLNWLKANPLKIGLPGNAYYESAQLYLEPARDVSRSRLVLLPERDLMMRIKRDPSQGKGRILVSAQGGVTFFAVPDREGRLGRLEYKDDFGYGGGGGWGEEPGAGEELEVITLRKVDLLELNSEREPDAAAGWRVG